MGLGVLDILSLLKRDSKVMSFLKNLCHKWGDTTMGDTPYMGKSMNDDLREGFKTPVTGQVR